MRERRAEREDDREKMRERSGGRENDREEWRKRGCETERKFPPSALDFLPLAFEWLSRGASLFYIMHRTVHSSSIFYSHVCLVNIKETTCQKKPVSSDRCVCVCVCVCVYMCVCGTHTTTLSGSSHLVACTVRQGVCLGGRVLLLCL